MERQFEIIGEALGQLSKLEPQLADRITDRRRIISFRNMLIHGYAEIDDRIVWGVIQGGLQQLLRESSALFEQARGDVGP